MSKPKYLVNEARKFGKKKRFVRVWLNRRERSYVVQIWREAIDEGQPLADWGMPQILGLEASIEQAYLQTDWT